MGIKKEIEIMKKLITLLVIITLLSCKTTKKKEIKVTSIEGLYSPNDNYTENGVRYPKYMGSYREVIKDFNKDGLKDTLYYFSDNGSGYGGYEIGLFTGTKGEYFTTSNEYPYEAIYNTIYLDTILKQEKNKEFLKVLKNKALEGYKFSEHISSSLEWILSAMIQKKDLKGNPYFKFYITPTTTWRPYNKGNNTGCYYTTFTNEIVKKWAIKTKDRTDELAFITHCNLLKNKEDFKPIGNTKNGKVYMCRNDIFIQKGNDYKYLFAVDGDIFKNAGREHSNGIEEVYLVNDNYLIINQVFITAHYLFVLNTETGFCAEIKQKYYKDIYFGNGKLKDLIKNKKLVNNLTKGLDELTEIPFF